MAAFSAVNSISVGYDVFYSDRFPINIEINIEKIIRQRNSTCNSGGNPKVKWVKRDLRAN